MTKTGWYDENHRTRCGLPENVLAAFHRDIDKLIARYFEKDEDGDMPVRVYVVDRTDTGPIHYDPMPHLLKPNDPEMRLLRAYCAASFNVEQAASDLRSIRHEITELLKARTENAVKAKERAGQEQPPSHPKRG